jgi:hypothetical protein
VTRDTMRASPLLVVLAALAVAPAARAQLGIDLSAPKKEAPDKGKKKKASKPPAKKPPASK